VTSFNVSNSEFYVRIESHSDAQRPMTLSTTSDVGTVIRILLYILETQSFNSRATGELCASFCFLARSAWKNCTVGKKRLTPCHPRPVRVASRIRHVNHVDALNCTMYHFSSRLVVHGLVGEGQTRIVFRPAALFDTRQLLPNVVAFGRSCHMEDGGYDVGTRRVACTHVL
jgi:hypothetical protein